MIKPFYFLTILFFTLSCNSKKIDSEELKTERTDKNANISKERIKIVEEIKTLQKDLEEGNFEEIANHLDTPKRIEELELALDNSKIRNAIESSSSRLSIDAIRNHYDILYDVLDLNIINESIKNISEDDLLNYNKNSASVKIGECDYKTEISINDKEVKFSINSESDECKKDQQWKLISNGESLILDRRYYL